MARRARARLNGALAKQAKLAGAYVIGHQGIQAQQGKGLYDHQDLVNFSNGRNHMFMADILIWVEKVLLPFHMVYKALQIHCAMAKAYQSRDLKTVMSNLSIN